jgi:protein-tyrosine sulfotransferase
MTPTVETDQIPIFVLGITPRSGTNFLHRLLCQHPDVGSVTKTAAKEDFLVHHAHHIREYIRSVAWQWSHWGDESDLADALTKSFGRGIQHFLASHVENRFIALKTPSVRGIEHFFDLFPEAYLIVIVRDGRSVVASGMSGFDWDFEAATRHWAKAARTLLRFREQSLHLNEQCRIIRYEDLNENTLDEYCSLLDFVGLQSDGFDVEDAIDLPIYGSSFASKSEGQVSWQPVEKTRDFSSTQRWETWDKRRHERFNWLAGGELEALGYALQGSSRSDLAHVTINTAYDLAYASQHWPRLLLQSARQGLTAMRGHVKLNRHSHLKKK